ncbi:7TM diverse intracellular signaling domain-containing protein [Sphingobacterium sp. CZ-2]|uniref:sensor histidine kinase n=1 Tax=Sphingobacterium sp. CZ-2 TaxID=2557994 RepID=UPI00107006BB|nr:7TM diverse intracellular signaling domain-containing protein [Sphingobacterium sp. CZ-2]QBR13567.1 histidine kinase [Sphingobacterium sp. CZ-2]
MRKFRPFFLCLVLLSISAKILAGDNIIRYKGEDILYLGKKLQIYSQESDQLELREVLSRPELFEQSRIEVPNLGIDQGVHWIKFEILNESDKENLMLDLSMPNIDRVKFYRVGPSGTDSTVYFLGEPLNRRKFKHQFFLFDLHLKKGERAICFLQLTSSTQLTVPVSLHSLTGLFRFLQQEDTLSAIYFGLMLSLIFYNGFIYISTKDRNYLSYVGYVFWVMFAQLAILGLFERIFQVGNEWINSRVLTFGGAMSGIATINFVKTFLQTSTRTKYFNSLLNIFLLGYLLSLVLLLMGYISLSYKAVNMIAGVGGIIVLLMASILAKTGGRQTRLFLFAWYVFIISVLVFILKDYQILPTNVFTTRAIQIGSIIEALILSFALADKINSYRKELIAAKLRELEISRENQRLIMEQNMILEDQVQKRTHELQMSNESLNKTLVDLRETQAQLVESEKMASLGQLTAGVAHEINNPINFVTSSITPLRRDIEILWELLERLEDIAISDGLGSEQKKGLIELAKSDQDIPYLKQEIHFLLKGVQDGAERTSEIVKSLRVFSRVDEDSLKFADIIQGIESTLVILNTMIRESIQVHKEFQEIPLIECFPGKLNQVFMNILTNSIHALSEKFGESFGARITIQVRLIEENGEVEIRFQDNGTGIPREIMNRIFDPFFTTKEVGEGTGLGMSIAYKTIERHNGKILVESVQGEGATFIIILPVRQNN